MRAEVEAELGGQLQIRQGAPDFERVIPTRGGEGMVIDLVKDVSPQLHTQKIDRDHITVDPPDEIRRTARAAAADHAPLP